MAENVTLDLRYPAITGKTADEKITEMQSYMKQMVDQLNYAVNYVSSVNTTGGSSLYDEKVAESNSNPNKEDGEKTFSEKFSDSDFRNIKQLILTSGDIINNYYEHFVQKLRAELKAYSGDFGDYLREVEQILDIGADKITQNINDVQIVNKDALITEAFITSGYIGDDENGLPMYGVCIRQSDTFGKLIAGEITYEGKTIDEMSAEEVKLFIDNEVKDEFKRMATFTADGLTFYDANNNKVAYVRGNADTGQSKLYIVNAEIESTLKIGNYIIMTTKGLAFKWREDGGNAQ